MTNDREQDERASAMWAELRPGTELGDRYVIEKVIGRGGIGAVFLANDRNLLGRRVVIKVLLDEISQSNAGDYFRIKFGHEIKALARINHPGVVGILDAGYISDGKAFLVMEYVDGVTLRAELDELLRNHIDGMPFDRVAYIITHLGAALTAAHTNKIFHRDLKPENIMIKTVGNGQQVKIIDFGIASVTDTQSGAFKTSTAIVGTIAYMAPEQFHGKPTASSDIFALGVIAYEILTGRRPFNPPNQFQALDTLKLGVRIKPSLLRLDLPPAAEEIILRALSFNAKDRPEEALKFSEELASALRTQIEDLPPQPPPPPVIDPETEQMGSHHPPGGRAQVEMAHVLSLEIMGFSWLKTQQQLHLVQEVQRIVRETEEFRSATRRKEVICRSAGYAMTIVFRRDPEYPVRCAVQIAKSLGENQQMKLRMGMHSGSVALHEDINYNIDAAGAGINIAKAVMECGDAGHMLVSKNARDLLNEVGEWAESLHDLGEWEVKPGERLHLFNFCADETGNPEKPQKVKFWESGGKVDDKGDSLPPPPPRPRNAILTQTLNVVYHRDSRGQEGLRYTPHPLGDVVPPHALVRIQSQIIQSYVGALRLSADDLTRRALVNQNRGGKGIEQAASELARYVLPEKGIAGIIGQGVHPQFDTYLDVASEIPWEALEESYFICSNGHRTAPAVRASDPYKPFCEKCGDQMVPAGGKLALVYHLTHLVHGSGRPAAEGRQFLFIEDPTGDLCNSERDPQGFCANHLETLHQIIERHGYTINLLRGGNATVRRVLKAISNPSVVAIYYFGHGYFPQDGDEGCLVLADTLFPASQIETAAPMARFVFLNACEGAAAGRNWDLDNRPRNVANAFAQGSLVKVVISPLLPVVSTQAAEAALEFFKHASLSAPSGEALRKARQMSFQRYQADEPHLAWMAYRYLGDPNRPLPVPVEASVIINPDEVTPHIIRVFDADGQINEEVFAFEVDEVFFRAAKRRNLQGRITLSAQDFIAGLLRKGDLTRHLLRRRGKDPDLIYEKIYEVVEEPEAQPGENSHRIQALHDLSNLDFDNLNEEKLRDIFSKWVVREKDEIRAELINALEKADLQAQQRQAGDQRISEQDILECIIEEAAWGELSRIGLLAPDEIRRLLEERKLTDEVDENGGISLAALDAEARKIIEAAHILSKQRGEFPIPNRLMLAAFLADEKRVASKVLRSAGYDPQKLFEIMMATTEGRSPLSFALSEEACSRVVTPVIELAASNKPEGEQIREEELFRAFCAKADPKFKQALQQIEPQVDLDCIFELLQMTLEARKVIETAHAISQQRGISPIPIRLMLAAFLTEPDGNAAQAVRRQGARPDQLRQDLIGSTASLSSEQFPITRQACEKVVTPVINRAKEIAEGADVSEEILFKAFCDVVPESFTQALRQNGVDLRALGSGIGPVVTLLDDAQQKKQKTGSEQFDEKTWGVLVESARLARMQGWAEVRTPHLFAAMIGDGSGVIGLALKRENINPEEMKAVALELVPPRPPVIQASGKIILGKNAQRVVSRAMQIAASAGRARVSEDDLAQSFFADEQVIINELLRRVGVQNLVIGASPAAAGKRSVLDALGIDLTEKARSGQLAEIVGRDAEIETAMQTLLLTENANPLFVGEAGVGKTAIVEGIARRITRGQCPARLCSMRVIELSAGSLVANTQMRGDFEQRMQNLLSEASENIILFIDEIHTIVGAGSGNNGLDAGNLLKAALARGEVRLIGATTHAEYEQTIARDKALLRRFQTQVISPPSREATIKILSAQQKILEQHHGVRITRDAKIAAVDLSGRFILNKQWPAKARDVLERACVLADSRRKGHSGGRAVVTVGHIVKEVSRLTGIPLDRVSTREVGALATLEGRIAKRIIGQQAAIQTLVAAIRRGRQGLSGAKKPWGVFLLIGPPGVGKTELAKVLAAEVFGEAEGLIRFDMGDFTEPHSKAKLIGAPQGYLGYNQGAPLVEHLRKHPYSLLLFDEIEHAHEDVLAVLLRLLAEGTIADADGNLADARNSIIILTSNLLAAEREGRRPGFALDVKAQSVEQSQAGLRLLLERHLPNKFIDRLDAIIRLNQLTVDDLEAIADAEIVEIVNRAAVIHKVSVEVDPKVARWIAEKAASENSGARAVPRAIDQYIASPLGAILSRPQMRGGMRIQIVLSGDVIEVKEATAVADHSDERKAAP